MVKRKSCEKVLVDKDANTPPPCPGEENAATSKIDPTRTAVDAPGGPGVDDGEEDLVLPPRDDGDEEWTPSNPIKSTVPPVAGQRTSARLRRSTKQAPAALDQYFCEPQKKSQKRNSRSKNKAIPTESVPPSTPVSTVSPTALEPNGNSGQVNLAPLQSTAPQRVVARDSAPSTAPVINAAPTTPLAPAVPSAPVAQSALVVPSAPVLPPAPVLPATSSASAIPVPSIVAVSGEALGPATMLSDFLTPSEVPLPTTVLPTLPSTGDRTSVPESLLSATEASEDDLPDIEVPEKVAMDDGGELPDIMEIETAAAQPSSSSSVPISVPTLPYVEPAPSPAKKAKGSRAKKTANNTASPKKKLPVVPETPEMSSLGRKLSALDKNELIDIIKRAVYFGKAPSCASIENDLPKPNVKEFTKEIRRLKSAVMKAVPRNFYGSNRDHYSFLRCQAALNEFAKVASEQLSVLSKLEDWNGSLEYALSAGCLIMELPSWDQEGDNYHEPRIRGQLMELLGRALPRLSFTTARAQALLREIEEKRATNYLSVVVRILEKLI